MYSVHAEERREMEGSGRGKEGGERRRERLESAQSRSPSSSPPLSATLPITP